MPSPSTMGPPSLSSVMKLPGVRNKLLADPDSFQFSVAPQLVVSVTPGAPHLAVLTREDGSLGIDGPSAKTLDVLAAAINFTYKLVMPSEGSRGLQQPNGSWNGMVGQVHRQEADMGIGPIVMTYSRSTVVDFTAPIMQGYYRILMKRGQLQPDPWGFLRPFSSYMWLSLLLVGLAMSLMLLMPTVVIKGRLLAKQHLAMWSDNLLVLFRVFIGQDLNVNTSSDTVCLLTACWFLFCLVVMKCYAGNLTSQLSVRHMPVPISNLDDLVKHPTIKVTLVAKTTFSEYVKSADSGLFGELNKFYDQGRITEVNSDNITRVMREIVSNGEQVMITDELTLLKLLSQEFSITGSCDYLLGADRFKPYRLSFIGQNDHPLMPALSSRILSVVEGGMYMRWIHDEIPNATSCNTSPSTMTVSEAYGIKGLWGVFGLLAAGLSMSVVLLLCEILNPQLKDMPPSIARYRISTNRVVG